VVTINLILEVNFFEKLTINYYLISIKIIDVVSLHVLTNIIFAICYILPKIQLKTVNNASVKCRRITDNASTESCEQCLVQVTNT